MNENILRGNETHSTVSGLNLNFGGMRKIGGMREKFDNGKQHHMLVDTANRRERERDDLGRLSAEDGYRIYGILSLGGCF